LYNRPEVAAVPSGLSPTPLKKKMRLVGLVTPMGEMTNAAYKTLIEKIKKTTCKEGRKY
jgi:hypothetical protein